MHSLFPPSLSSRLQRSLSSLRQCSLSSTAGNNRHRAVAFFHPYTNGGGGERVLWCAVKAIQDENPNLDCVVFTGDHDSSPDSLTSRAVDLFGVKLLHPPKVVYLYKRKWIEEATYPRLTMIGQSLGSVYLSWEALTKFSPFDESNFKRAMHLVVVVHYNNVD